MTATVDVDEKRNLSQEYCMHMAGDPFFFPLFFSLILGTRMSHAVRQMHVPRRENTILSQTRNSITHPIAHHRNWLSFCTSPVDFGNMNVFPQTEAQTFQNNWSPTRPCRSQEGVPEICGASGSGLTSYPPPGQMGRKTPHSELVPKWIGCRVSDWPPRAAGHNGWTTPTRYGVHGLPVIYDRGKRARI